MSKLTDGYQTLISFASDPTVLFYEKTVTPPGFDAGGEIDQTIMANTALRTSMPKALLSVSNSSLTVAYDPACYDEVKALAGVNNLITVTFPDGSTLVYWGWLNTFTPSELQEGEQPTAEMEIITSNLNDSDVETGPVYAAAA